MTNNQNTSHANKAVVHVLNPSCQIEDLEIGSDYEGVITRVEKYGFFVSLSKSVYGLLRSRNP
ncbi:MAG TPA: S1 RNA-binding domain-containing protein, partial [Methanosphaera sp.]|nr:S1 RNA-binding domain-containing protein [Methanosphaera sp.]